MAQRRYRLVPCPSPAPLLSRLGTAVIQAKGAFLLRLLLFYTSVTENLNRLLLYVHAEYGKHVNVRPDRNKI